MAPVCAAFGQHQSRGSASQHHCDIVTVVAAAAAAENSGKQRVMVVIAVVELLAFVDTVLCSFSS